MDDEYYNAIKTGDMEKVRGFVESDQMNVEKPFQCDPYYLRPLAIASHKGHIEIVKYLLEKGADIHSCNKYAVRYASANGHFEVVKFLCEKGADIHDAIRHASYHGQLEIVKFLWEKGADIHSDNNNAMCWACYNNHLSVVKFLWQKGANIPADNGFTLRQASYFGKHEMIKFLCEKGADISQLSEFHRKYLLFCEKIEMKRQVEAANKIGRWWIPICYDTKRECGKRMMERGWEKYESNSLLN